MSVEIDRHSSRAARLRLPGAAGAAVAALLGLLVYLNALDNPFVYDDHRTILANAAIRGNDWRALVWQDLARPLVNLSYALDYRLWGPAPFGFHLTNVLLHALNVLLVAGVARTLAADLQRARPAATAPDPAVVAIVAAALFAVHPMMTESVGYVSGRAELLSATFVLVALLCGRRWALAGGARWGLLAAASWVAAALAKEVAVMLPPVLIVCDWLLWPDAWPARRRRLLRRHAPFLVAALAAGVLRFTLFAGVEHSDLAVHWLSILDEIDVVRRYFVLLVVPAGQTIAHHVQPVGGILDPIPIRGVAALGLAVAFGWAVRRRAPLVTAGLTWFLLFLVPSSLLVVLGRGEGMAEHRVYLASVGFFLVVGYAAGMLDRTLARASRPLRRLTGVALGVVVLSLAGRTVLRNAVWSSPVTLWQEAVDLAPASWLPRTALGESLHDAGRHEEAAAEFQAAIRLRPAEPLGYLKAALCLAERGRFGEAAGLVESLRARDPDSPIVPTSLGIVAVVSGEVDAARRHLREGIDRDAGSVVARQWLAVLEGDLAGRPAEALRLCEEIDQLAPGDPDAAECLRRNRARLSAR